MRYVSVTLPGTPSCTTCSVPLSSRGFSTYSTAKSVVAGLSSSTWYWSQTVIRGVPSVTSTTTICSSDTLTRHRRRRLATVSWRVFTVAVPALRPLSARSATAPPSALLPAPPLAEISTSCPLVRTSWASVLAERSRIYNPSDSNVKSGVPSTVWMLVPSTSR